MLRDVRQAAWKLRLSSRAAQVELETRELVVTGHGTGRLQGDTLTLDVHWLYAAKNCSGTMRLTGGAANGGAALIGEFDYRDGCDRDQDKKGTFALWRGKRNATSLARP